MTAVLSLITSLDQDIVLTLLTTVQAACQAVNSIGGDLDFPSKLFPCRPLNNETVSLLTRLLSVYTQGQSLASHALIIHQTNDKFTMKQRTCFVLPFSEGGHLDYAPAWLRPFHSATKIVKK